MNLPDDMFKQELLPYLTLHDIVKLDNACMNHKYRSQLMDKISGVILRGDKDKSMKASLFKWLGIRRIYLIKMKIVDSVLNLPSSTMKNDYVDQFRYTHHVIMRGAIRDDDMAIFILSHCPCLLSIVIGDYAQPSPQITGYDDLTSSYPQITDRTLQSIAEHCTGLQSLSLSDCGAITDSGLRTISTHITGLQSLNLESCQITDASIISISTHCTGLQLLNLGGCRKITDASIISISTHCMGLQSLNLDCCRKITDASIISISTHCTGLQSLNLCCCNQIIDASFISISENCTGLKELNVSYTNITDASLIAISKNCTGLQLLYTYDCNRLSSDEIRDRFKSVSELRSVLLSIYPSLLI